MVCCCPSLGQNVYTHTILASLTPLSSPCRRQVPGGPGDLLQGREEGGALRHHLQEDRAEEGPGHTHGVGDRTLGAQAGRSPQRLQAHSADPGLPGLHPPAHAAALRHHPGEVLPPHAM